MENLFFLCIALSPTQESKLMEVQRACFLRYHHPSSYALPPVLPIACHHYLEDAFQAWKTTTFLKDWRPFVLSGVSRVGNILVAGPTPILRDGSTRFDPSPLGQSFSPDSCYTPHTEKIDTFASLGGFYISLIEPLSTIEPFCEFPLITVRVVRFQVLRIASTDLQGSWWKEIEWTIEKERWIKFKQD